MVNFDVFILEFSEAQQCFHHNHGLDVPGTNGFITVYQKCTWLQDCTLGAYLDLKHPGKRTAAQVIKAAKEVTELLENLDGLNIEVKFKGA
jgi:hypothetical protein